MYSGGAFEELFNENNSVTRGSYIVAHVLGFPTLLFIESQLI